jgi:hypothetical protein
MIIIKYYLFIYTNVTFKIIDMYTMINLCVFWSILLSHLLFHYRFLALVILSTNALHSLERKQGNHILFYFLRFSHVAPKVMVSQRGFSQIWLQQK